MAKKNKEKRGSHSKLAEHLSNYETTMYISAEQGTSKTFRDAYMRAQLDPFNRRLKDSTLY